jgi:two-component system, OmpR family, manganese sensing sensor histidine kinase
MFQKIRTRLLINNILVFALVMAGSAIAVRLVFIRNLQQQMANQLTTLGQSVVAEAELDKGRLKVEEDYLAQPFINREQSFEWFDSQGNLVESVGEHFPKTLLDRSSLGKVAVHDRLLQSTTLSLLGTDNQQPIGYVRVSQTLEEFDETVLQLDVGLGVGVIVATIFSSAGIVWLNRQAMQPIEESFQRLKQFTADASHEFRSPLMAISSNMEVALKYPEGMRDEDREAMIAVMSATEQMTHLTEDLLLLARTDKGSKQPPDAVNVAVDLTKMLNNLAQLYRPQAEMKKINLSADIGCALSTQGDCAALIKAFTNLLQNAIRYTPSGGEIHIKATRVKNQLQVVIKDTGVGIADKNLEKIFERFWRADQARNYDNGGSGLGLPITQTIIESHGGTIEVASKLGAGSCFTISLPAMA